MAFDPGVAALGVSTPYDDAIYAAAGGDASRAALIKGIIAAESAWNPSAVNPSDPSYGLMQITVATARQFSPGITSEQLVSDPRLNISIGSAFILDLLRRYSMSDAVAYYNAGCPRSSVAGVSGCPLRNSIGQYVNSKGSTAVQAYVDSVITYQVYYLNRLPAEVVPSDGTSSVIGEAVSAFSLGSLFQNLFGTTPSEPVAADSGEVLTEDAGTSGFPSLEGAGIAVGIAAAIGAAVYFLWPKGS